MDEHKLTEIFRLQSGEVPGRTRFCPEDELITEYFEGSLADLKRANLKRHLVDCRFCLARVGNLQRLGNESDGHYVPGSVLADAKQLAKQSQPKRNRYAPAWAAAAVVVLALSTITLLGPRPAEDSTGAAPDARGVQENPRQVRNNDPAAFIPNIIAPVDGATVESDEFSIRWTKVPGSLHYEVRVVSVEGFIIWNDRVEGTELQPPLGQLLEPGMSYYLRVDAYLAEANSVSSEHILFSVEAQKP